LNIKSSEKKEKSTMELVVEVSVEEFDSAINDAFKKNRNSIAVPGFRKGKAPRKIIERLYGASIFHADALDILAPTVVQHTVKETELKIIGYPQIIDVDIKEEGGVDLTVSVSIYPEIALGEYKGLSAYKPKVEVSDSEIDSEIAGIRLRNARIEKADRPAINKDTVLIDYEGFIDGEAFDGGKGEGYELELGSNTFIPGFEEKLHGMVVGEERDIDLVFPDEYAENLAGKAVVFKVKLHEIKEKILPDLDDEFAKDVSEFDTLDEYKESIRESIAKVKQADADAVFENTLMEQIIDSIDGEIPDELIDEQLQNALNNFVNQTSNYGMDPSVYLQMMGETPDSFRDKMRVSSEKQVRGSLALEKIADLEGVVISEEELTDAYASLAERYGMEIDDIKDSMAEESVVQDAKITKAMKIVSESATALDTPPVDESADADADGHSHAHSHIDGHSHAHDIAEAADAAADVAAAEAADAADNAAAKPKKAPAKKTSSTKAKAAAADAAADSVADAVVDASTVADEPGSAVADGAGVVSEKPVAKKASTKKTTTKKADADGAAPAVEAADEAVGSAADATASSADGAVLEGAADAAAKPAPSRKSKKAKTDE